jgi:hypothetical protein
VESSSLVTGESSSVNIALCNIAEARCNYVQEQSVIRRIPKISSLNIYSNVKLNSGKKLSAIVLSTEEAGRQSGEDTVYENCNDS